MSDLHGLAMDTLNGLLEDVEARFAARGLGVRATVPFVADCDLAFGKLDGKWQLIVVWPDREERLLGHAVLYRLEAVSCLRALSQALYAAGDQHLINLHRACEDIEAFLIEDKEAAPIP